MSESRKHNAVKRSTPFDQNTKAMRLPPPVVPGSMKTASIICALAAIVLTTAKPGICATSKNTEAQKTLLSETADHLSKATKASAQLAKGVLYRCIEIDPLAIAHVVSIDTTGDEWSLKPFMSDLTETTSEMASRVDAVVAVNAGFFNLSDGESASYIVIDGKQVCEPRHNMALVNNRSLRPFLTQIFNRSEVRVLKNKDGKSEYRIQAHTDAIPAKLKLVHSLQAGPQLLPKLTSRPEAFVRTPPGGKTADSIGTNMRAARTCLGIGDSGILYLVCVQGRRTKEFSEGISLLGLSDFMRQLGCGSAINFDGGTSTTMVLKLAPELRETLMQCPAVEANLLQNRSSEGSQLASTGESKFHAIVSSAPERKVKSILCLTKAH